MPPEAVPESISFDLIERDHCEKFAFFIQHTGHIG